jgi:hypothetical protein
VSELCSWKGGDVKVDVDLLKGSEWRGVGNAGALIGGRGNWLRRWRGRIGGGFIMGCWCIWCVGVSSHRGRMRSVALGVWDEVM